MPLMDGWELSRRIESGSGFRASPDHTDHRPVPGVIPVALAMAAVDRSNPAALFVSGDGSLPIGGAWWPVFRLVGSFSHPHASAPVCKSGGRSGCPWTAGDLIAMVVS